MYTPKEPIEKILLREIAEYLTKEYHTEWELHDTHIYMRAEPNYDFRSVSMHNDCIWICRYPHVNQNISIFIGDPDLFEKIKSNLEKIKSI